MVGGVKALILLLVVVCVGCGTTSVKTPKPTTTSWVSDPSDPNNVKIEAAIRKAANKPTGELTKVDLEKVTRLNLYLIQLTDVRGLEKLTNLAELYLFDNQLTSVNGLKKLTKLRGLYLNNNPALTKAQIAELQKALPNVKINSNARKQPPNAPPLTPALAWVWSVA